MENLNQLRHETVKEILSATQHLCQQLSSEKAADSRESASRSIEHLANAYKILSTKHDFKDPKPVVKEEAESQKEQ